MAVTVLVRFAIATTDPEWRQVVLEAASRALFAMMPGSAPSEGCGSPVQGTVVDARTHWPIGGATILVGTERDHGRERPFHPGYVVVSQLVAEGQAIGTIVLGGAAFQVSIAVGRLPDNL
jgi:hypothetical protein